jgi:hypothetical protein
MTATVLTPIGGRRILACDNRPMAPRANAPVVIYGKDT